MLTTTASPLLQTAHHVIRSGARAGGLSEEEVGFLFEPEAVTEVSIDAGSGDTVRGWRVRHNTRRGAAKGGVRFTPSVTRDDVEGLATLMTLKTAVAHLPLGGGKGGLMIPADADDDRRRELAVAFGRQLSDALGPDLDVAAPDIGTNGAAMAAMIEGWADANGVDPDSREARGIVTGKSMSDGGLDLRTGATARGLEAAIRHLTRHHEVSSDCRVAIQGFGAVGGTLAAELAADGWNVVAVSDSSGAIHDGNGLDVEAVRRAKSESGSVDDGPGESLPSDELVAVDCDVLVLAATEAAITADNAHSVKASAIVEGSNAPCTADGEGIIRDRNITVVPDIVANAGGVVGSWIEMMHTADRGFEEPGQRFAETIESTNERLWAFAAERGIGLRDAATLIAIAALERDQT